ncbi:MAG: gluconate transporter [Lachnospiraceae bacterium]|nr:gluconate transporter [Lachnospiraceae bacterium]
MARFLIVLLLAVIILVFMIVKLGIHPVLALFISGVIAGLGFGYDVGTTITVFTTGFGGTMTSIACTIIFGSIIAQGIRDTSGVKSMVNFFINVFHGKCLELATALSAFIMSIPVFGDITQVLLSPVAALLAKRKKISMSVMGGYTLLCSSLTHSIVPPTPGILAVAVLLEADLGFVILWGIVISLIGLFVCWGFGKKILAKDWIEPREDFIVGVEEVKSDDYHELLIKEEGLPNVALAMAPILVPAILIAVSSFCSMYMAEDNTFNVIMQALGNRNVALFIGVLITFMNGVIGKEKVFENFKNFTGKTEKSLLKIMTNEWVAEALSVALIPLLVTGMGGGFSQIIKNYDNVHEGFNTALGTAVAGSGLPMLLVPFLIGAVMMIAVGSRTTAGMTAAAICVPMMGQLGLSPVAVTLLIGCGTMIGSHVSDSGFWVGTAMFNLDTKQGLKYITLLGSICGVVCLAAAAILLAVGII